MAVKALLPGAQVLKHKSWFSASKQTQFYVIEVAFFGGNCSIFMDAKSYAVAIAETEEGENYDIVCEMKLNNGKFEIAEGSCTFHPPGAISFAKKKEPGEKPEPTKP